MIMILTKVAFPLSGLLFLHLLVMFMIPPSAFSHSVVGSGLGVEFLAQLQGCGKGDTLKGVNQLKLYLQKYGYLHYDNNNHADAAAHEDEFDEVVESALKTYQLNYRLNTSGVLDMQTIKQMMKPRCGVPDIIHGTTRMQSGKKNKKNKQLTVSHYAFFRGYPRWPPTQTHLTYTFGPRVDEVVGLDTLRPVISRAFRKWAAVSSFTFEEAQPGTRANLLIEFESGNHGDGVAFDGPGGALAHAFAPTTGLLHYDADDNWSTNPDPDLYEIDLESVGLHEIGHLLGLGHSGDPEAAMHSGISPGELRRQLNEDDVQGIRALYN